MVVERRNFQRCMTLTHRVIHWDDERDALTRPAGGGVNAAQRCWSLGIFAPSGWLITIGSDALSTLLANWREEGMVVPVKVEELGDM